MNQARLRELIKPWPLRSSQLLTTLIMNNKSLYSIPLLATLFTLAIPAFAFAEPGATTTKVSPSPKTVSSSVFCKNSDVRLTKWQTAFSADTTKRQQYRTTEDTNRAANKQKADAALAKHRTSWDTLRGQYFAKLEAKATTSVQKSAETAFETSIKTAVTTKHTANDASTQTFRTGEDQLVTARRTNTDAAIATRNQAVLAAAQAAKDGCVSSSTTNVDTLRVAYNAAVKAAVTAFKASEVKTNTIAKTSVDALRATRRSAEAADYATYKQSVVAARDLLKTALGQK